MSAAATISPAFHGLPWLVSAWRQLREAVDTQHVTSEQQQALSLIEYAAHHFGDPLLEAASLDDLDNRLDELIDSTNVFAGLAALLEPHLAMFQAVLPRSIEWVSEDVTNKLGAAQARLLVDAQPLMAAWLDVGRQATATPSGDRGNDFDQVFLDLMIGPELPVEIAQGLFHIRRLSICNFVIARIMMSSSSVEPWLSRAIVERLIASLQQALRLLASTPGISVDPAIVPEAQRFDLQKLAAQFRRARAASQRSLEQARARFGL